jgi:hypothetical protein
LSRPRFATSSREEALTIPEDAWIPTTFTSIILSPAAPIASTGLDSSGLDPTTKVGLGAGLGLGIPLLIFLVVGCILHGGGSAVTGNRLVMELPLPTDTRIDRQSCPKNKCGPQAQLYPDSYSSNLANSTEVEDDLS